MTDLRDRLQATLRGSYTLDRELGGGGMSRVFVAEELRLGRQVVVKVLSPELAAGISAERFEREIRMAASLQQANIVPVLAAGETNGLPYYTMPFVEGESLRARLAAERALPMSDVLRILGDVARALQFAHARGVVHRDIKPDNVLLSGGTAVVTDFGIAKALSASRTGGAGATLTQVGTSIGTPAYMAPEQAAGDPEVDHRADLYAFGCLAYELLAGHPPFHGRTPQRVLAAHLSETPTPLAELRADVPAPLAELVMRCLAKDADDRPQAAAEVIAVLNATTSGSGMTALPPVLLHGPGAMRRALLVYAASVLGVATVAQAATVVIGLPAWVLPGALVAMALGLPMILFTGYVQRVARRALLATPAPGGGSRAQGTMATLALKASPHVSWRRATRAGVYAFGAFAGLVVLYMVLRAFGIGPAGSLLAAGKLAERDLLLVADFDVRGADSSVANVVAEGVRVALGQSPSVTLMSATDVAAALGRMERSPASRVDLALARQIAQREGVKAIVDGDVTALGTGYVIALRLVAADSGTVLARHQTTVDGLAGLTAGIDELTRELRGRMGESLRSVRASPPLEQVTTASFDALGLYTQAIRAADMEGDPTAAIEHLRQAVALDTAFAMAWRKLGVVMYNQFFPQSAVDSALDRAFALRARLPERDRYLTEGSYYVVGRGRDRMKAIAAYEALLRRGDSTYARNNLASRYMSRREFARAEALLRAELRQRPEHRLAAGNLASALELQGRHAEADSVHAELLRSAPHDPLGLLREVDRLYRERRFDETTRLADSVGHRGATPALRTTATFVAADLALVRGRLGDYARLRDLAVDLDSAIGTPRPPAVVDSNEMARLDAWFRGDGERAARRLDATLAALPLTALPEPDRPYTELAATYAMAGRPDRARVLLAQRAAQLTDSALVRSQAPLLHRALGEIALAEGRAHDAIAEFRRGDMLPDGPAEETPLPTLFGLGRAFDRAGMPDSAIAAFERYLATPAHSRPVHDKQGVAGIRRRLGELYEARGDWARAVPHYAAFVELWKDADPELQPQVEAVRARLARGTDRAR